MTDHGAQLVVHNSLTRATEPFRPREPGQVGMYSCGPTVYAYPHIGNLRTYVFSDTLHRTLLWKGYQVRKVVNITDVGHLVADADEGEDKLETAARESTRSVYDLARHYESAFFADIEALRILPANVYPRATDHIGPMIEFAEELERRGVAYRLPTGLYLDTSRVTGYGRLAAMRPEDQREGARVEVVTGKRNKTDFALWRVEAPGERRLMRWESPWGWGAPGWHLECSVMSIALLGRHFDVHTGGVDHRELHHVNEMAQSESYLDDGQEWVRYWMHAEFLNIKRAKMAKSEGTGLRLVGITERGLEPAAYRLSLLGAHYRSQTHFSWTAVESAATTLRRMRTRIAAAGAVPRIGTVEQAMARIGSGAGREVIRRMDEAVCDDLNTARALAAFQDGLRSDEIPAADHAVIAGAAEHLFALGLAEPAGHLAVPVDLAARIEDMVARRDTARATRDWTAADQIRDELAGLGVQIKDTPAGTEWELTHPVG